MVKIGLSALPSERYKRNVIRGKLDLVGEHFINCIPIDPRINELIDSIVSVSMGGTTGLFVGASLLSFVEIFYYFIVRPYYNIQKKK